ncbi:MAG: ABC transporter substrate-binding protein [Lachnospiraceae bacterium]|nr:ABC transporter substrate-binding protein [Lachnospiraceae bacterium]
MKKLTAVLLAGVMALGLGTAVFAEEASTEAVTEAAAESHYPVTITTYNHNQEPIEITFEKAPERVIAYGNSNVEAMLKLGLSDKIVLACGLDGEVKDEFKDDFDKLDYVDGLVGKEDAVALEPDFIAAWYSSFADDRLSDVDFWHERGCNTYMSLNSACMGPASEFPRKMEYEFQDILNLGAIFDCEDEAQAIVDEMQSEIDKVKEFTTDQTPLTVAVLENEGDSFRVYGTETLGGNIPESLGAELKLGAENSENVGAEDLIAADPDVLFMVDYDGFKTGEEAVADITEDPAYASLSAVQNGKVFSINLSQIYCSGIRTYDGIMTFATALYPDLYE